MRNEPGERVKLIPEKVHFPHPPSHGTITENYKPPTGVYFLLIRRCSSVVEQLFRKQQVTGSSPVIGSSAQARNR